MFKFAFFHLNMGYDKGIDTSQKLIWQWTSLSLKKIF